MENSLKKCVDCKHFGIELKHLAGYDNIKEWRDCNFPRPWHIASKTLPMVDGVGKDCKCFLKTTEPK